MCVLIFLLVSILCSINVRHSICSPIDIGNNLNNSISEVFELSIIHINDFHARFDETNEFSTECKRDQGEKCIGGYARAVSVIKNLLNTRKNPIYLNAGDNFSGTIWYKYGRWNVTSYFLNLLTADAMTLGNHEFDDEIEGVVPFLTSIETPIVVANIDDSAEPDFQGKYNKSIILEREGRKIGVIGVVATTTSISSFPEKLKFLDEVESVKAEATELKKQGVGIIIVLSHCGIDIDLLLAKNAGNDISVIVGGHSHTFMYSGNKTLGPDKAEKEYPTVVYAENGRKVLIVQASCYLKYVGDIVVYFDKNDNVIDWKGDPIYLDADVSEDGEMLQLLQPWKQYFNNISSHIVGETSVDLDGGNCFSTECSAGSFLSDAFVYFHRHFPNYTFITPDTPLIGIVVAGGIRSSLHSGVVTFGDLSSLIPFGEYIDLFQLSGQHLLETFEYSVLTLSPRKDFYSDYLLQVSGLKVVYNITHPPNNRVVSIDILHGDEYKPFELDKMYYVTASSFLNRNGGDGYIVIKNNRKNFINGILDLDVVKKYFENHKPVTVTNTGRITVLQ